MKTTFKTWANFAVILASSCLVVVILSAHAQGLKQVLNPPIAGTFYLLSFEFDDTQSPPYPLDPYEGTLPIYELNGFNGIYLVADSKEDYLAFRSRMDAQAYGEMGALAGDDGGGLYSRIYGSNDLWLELVAVTNGIANFTIHTPDAEEYDLFGTTNLSANVVGLSLTNWVWLVRTEIAETNIVLTNLWAEMGFFRLGTMQDSDSDGLTDAYELLVSHTDPTKWDTDGDGLSDSWEMEHGMNPNLDESAQASGRLNYQYDGSGWLRSVSGSWSEGITLDNEGNVQTVQ